MFANLFEEVKLENSWSGTAFEKYASLGPKQKGKYSEAISKSILDELGYKIDEPINAGHDFIMDGIKTELKFGLTSTANKNWRTIFNHIGFEKDWEQIIFGCVNGDGNIRYVLYNKEDVPQDLLKHQQGGNKSNNDDYMISGTATREILFGNGEVLYDGF